MSELLPCPFCGGKAYMQISQEMETFVYYIICPHCDSAGLKSFEKEKAIERWNTRHYPPEVEKAVERMKPKKVIPEKVYWAPKNRRAYFIRFLCPTCGGIANRATNREFCNDNGCGQALDWSE